jgi:hypothetical protein
MGILVGDREVVTCAHVIETALGRDWQRTPGGPGVRLCFPFASGSPCIEGRVDPGRWFPPGEPKGGTPTDVAIIVLGEDAPPSVGRAVLLEHAYDAPVKTYGFRGQQMDDDSWVSHPYGEWVVGAAVGPQPGGRGEFDGLRATGAAVERGFSGAGVYDPERDGVVGMIVESDREKARKIAQFVDVPSLRKAIGGDATGESSSRPGTRTDADRAPEGFAATAVGGDSSGLPRRQTSGKTTMDMTQMMAGGYIRLLAQLYHRPGSADYVFLEAGVPLEGLPAWTDFATPLGYWTAACNAIASGLTPGGLMPLLRAVAREYPGNPKLQEFRG